VFSCANERSRVQWICQDMDGASTINSSVASGGRPCLFDANTSFQSSSDGRPHSADASGAAALVAERLPPLTRSGLSSPATSSAQR
jgi:hypothetical protein